MIRKALFGVVMLGAAAAFTAAPVSAADPTLHEVYQAAEAGRLSDALKMMSDVLRDHPNSAKAHFVEAELLAKDGRATEARSELETAERLAPGLPFASDKAKTALRARLSGNGLESLGPSSGGGAVHRAVAPASSGMSWGPILLVGGLVALVLLIARSFARRPAAGGPAAGYSGGTGGTPQPYGPGPAGPVAGGGMGSGILGGLASGAALGAGLVAGEALAHRLIDGGGHPSNSTGGQFLDDQRPRQDDLGGSDFGVADNSSWDDSSGGGGGGDDWN